MNGEFSDCGFIRQCMGKLTDKIYSGFKKRGGGVETSLKVKLSLKQQPRKLKKYEIHQNKFVE